MLFFIVASHLNEHLFSFWWHSTRKLVHGIAMAALAYRLFTH